MAGLPAEEDNLMKIFRSVSECSECFCVNFLQNVIYASSIRHSIEACCVFEIILCLFGNKKQQPHSQWNMAVAMVIKTLIS